MNATTPDDITNEVLRRIQKTPDPRTREILLALVEHLHAFVKQVRLTEPEWLEGIRFLTETGHITDDLRQEFILLSDTLGVSMVVDLLSHPKSAGATESTVFGPFHREGAPELDPGENMAVSDPSGTPCMLSGRVLDTAGKPIAGALLDVWQASSAGLYDSQLPNPTALGMRGKYRSDAQGRFVIRTTRPVAYQIPSDGPVGKLLRATNRHPWRPAHVHFVVSAPGYEPVTTHLFDSIDPYLESDAVFAVKRSLIVELRANTEGNGVRAEFDFVLQPIP